MAINICFFNNKGGVGKTTLTCNVASYLATEFGKRVLLIDADPQCNSTQYILDLATYEDILNNKTYNTIIDIINPIKGGNSDINTAVVPLPANENRFNVDLIPGHPKFSLFEDKLGKSWLEMNNDIGSLRIMNWCYRLNKAFKDNYDIIVYDIGPSLGAINRTVLIGCDFFVTPMGCDTFSIMGISNISEWLKNCIELYAMNYNYILRKENDLVNEYSEYILPSDGINNQCRFAGYTVQQYIPTKTTKKGIRPTKAFEEIAKKIPGQINAELNFIKASWIEDDHLNLGQIPHLFSLVPLAQAANSPIFLLGSKDGINGSQYSQQRTYISILHEVSNNLLCNIGGSIL